MTITSKKQARGGGDGGVKKRARGGAEMAGRERRREEGKEEGKRKMEGVSPLPKI